jgi:hypothetical protein
VTDAVVNIGSNVARSDCGMNRKTFVGRARAERATKGAAPMGAVKAVAIRSRRRIEAVSQAV